jgi:hypothetical protein
MLGSVPRYAFYWPPSLGFWSVYIALPSPSFLRFLIMTSPILARVASRTSKMGLFGTVSLLHPAYMARESKGIRNPGPESWSIPLSFA